MRRLARQLFTLCSAASLVLCATMCVLWVLGPVTVGDYGNAWAGIPGRGNVAKAVVAFGHAFAFRSAGGTMRVHWNYIRRPEDRSTIGSIYGDAEPNRFGFAWNVAPTGRDAGNGKPWARQGTVAIPHWSVMLVSAVLPALWFHGRRRARYRVVRGLCPACGYDLRASPERCPECGVANPERTISN